MSNLGPIHVSDHTGLEHTATLIMLHGSGSSGGDLKEWVKMLMQTFSFSHIKIVYPSAPLQPYTPAGGSVSNVWFDRIEISPYVPEKLASIDKMEGEIKNLIMAEHIAGIPSNRIIIGGFSMGGALAMHAAFRWDRQLAGVFAFSSFLNENSIIYRVLHNSPGMPVPPLLQIHGDADDLVETRWGQETFDALRSLGVQGQFHIIERLGHSLHKRGLEMIKAWAESLLPKE